MHARSGFSLLELMVALAVGGIAITSIYAVGAASTRTFHQQHQVASTQSSLRIALGQIKRDFARAGYLATPNAGGLQSCATPATPLHDPHTSTTANGSLAGVAAYDPDVCFATGSGCTTISGPGSIAVAANRLNGFTGDSIVLMGNYETASEYGGISLLPGASTISVGSTWHAWQTDFMSWEVGTPTVFNAAAFNAVFPVGRLIRIRTTKGLYHFAIITSVTAPNTTVNPPTDAQIAFAPAVPGNCSSDVDGGWVAPINAIRYFPRDDPNPPANVAETYGSMAQLVRQETAPAAKQQAFLNGAVPPRVVLDYLVAFRLRFVMNGVTGLNAPDSYLPGNAAGNVNANPERVRAVFIDLAARTPEQDRSLAWSATTCRNMGCYMVFNNRAGAARVRSVHAEVFIPNVAFEGF